MIPDKLYYCGRCGEKFWLRNTQVVCCPSCGNTQLSPKSVTLDLKNKSMTLQNVVHGVREQSIIKINISGERRKALFVCKKCSVSFEADCTEGLHVVVCPQCNEKNWDIKSPIVSVISGVKGIPLPKKQWTKAEIKLARFAKECYAKKVEFEARCSALISLCHALEVSEQTVQLVAQALETAKNELERHIEKKISEYEKRIGKL